MIHSFLPVFLLLFAAPIAGDEVAGVKLPPKIEVSGKKLELNGMGLRTKSFLEIKVYVAGLYLEKPSKDAAEVISSDQLKRVHLTFLRSVDRSQITDAIEEGFERNSKGQMPALKARLSKLESFLTGMREKDELLVTYLPGKGTEISVKGTVQGVLEGKDFADALFSVWLGKDPVDKELKKALLGRTGSGR